MDVLSAVLLLVGGCGAGFLASYFGVGGGILLVPILLTFFQATGITVLVSTHLAFGTSLFVIVFSALVSAYTSSTNGHVIWRAVLIIGGGGVVGALLGGFLAGYLEAHVLRKIFGAGAVLSSILLFGGIRKPKGEQKPDLELPGLAGAGFVLGAVSSLTGVGGGLFSVPLLYSKHRFQLMKAFGTSRAATVMIAGAGSVAYIISGSGNLFLPAGMLGYVAPLHALPLILGIIPGGVLGDRVARGTKAVLPRKIFGVFLLVIATRMLFL